MIIVHNHSYLIKQIKLLYFKICFLNVVIDFSLVQRSSGIKLPQFSFQDWACTGMCSLEALLFSNSTAWAAPQRPYVYYLGLLCRILETEASLVLPPPLSRPTPSRFKNLCLTNMTVIFLFVCFEVFCEKREWQRAKSTPGGQNTVLFRGEVNLQFEAIKMLSSNCQSISL